MKIKPLNSKQKRIWWGVYILFNLLVGWVLIFALGHIFPDKFDLMDFKPHPGDPSEKTPHPPIVVAHASDQPFEYFIPLLVQGPEKAPYHSAEKVVDMRVEDVDFSYRAEPIEIKIFPQNELFNPSQPIIMRFTPDEHCAFGDGRGCVYQYSNHLGGRVLFISLHSGIGGVADSFRDFVEGTGINQALYPAARVDRRLNALVDSRISIEQDRVIIPGLDLIALVRIAPDDLPEYTALPVEDVLNYVVEISALDPDILSNDLLVFETCGWALPDEGQTAGLEFTSSSIYLGFIQLP